MATAAIIFALTYLVLGLQRLPRLHIGRPAGALLGATAMVLFGVLTYPEARDAIDLDTILFLLGMMIVLAYLELSGFFEVVEQRALAIARTPRQLLWMVVLTSGLLSAVFMNDTVVLMLTLVVLRLARRLELPPIPYLVATALAANVGSAATILGNPQNALIGVRSGIPFLSFAAALAPLSAAGLLVTGTVVAWIYRHEVTSRALPVPVPPAGDADSLSRWMLISALAAGCGMVVALAAGVPPAAAAIGAAALVILAGSTRPRVALQKVDWSLLLLFGGLFVVMEGVRKSGLAGLFVTAGAGPPATGWALAHLGAVVTFLSQAVSNVPTVMLFVPSFERLDPAVAAPAWLALAAFSTLAGNLTILASVANLIVVETARREGVEIRFRDYLRAGLPVTLLTLALAWAWLALRS